MCSSDLDWVAAVQAAISLPIVLFSVLGGAIADLWERRLVMMVAQCWMLLAAAVLALLTALSDATPVSLLVMTFALGAGQAFSNPAWQASVGQLVPRNVLPAAIVLGSMGFNLARSLGPALGGFIVAMGGAAAAFLFNAFSYVSVIVGLALWPRNEDKRSLPREHLFYAMVAGLRYVSAAPGIRAVMTRSCGFAMHSGAVLALLPLVAKQSLGGGPVTYGLLFGAFGVGAILGGFFSVRLRGQAGSERLLLASTTACSLATAIIGISPWIVLDIPALMVAGACWILSNSTFNFTVQMLAPNWVKARTLSIYQTSQFLGIVLGSWLWGHVATAFGIPVALVATGVFGLATLALVVRFPAPAVDNVDLTPADPLPAPDLALDLSPESGPIQIAVEYDIPPERGEAFQTAMREIRRIRRRDGAVGWSLYQDLNRPRRWVESYVAPTWADFLRMRERRTISDSQAFARVRAFHAGPGAPPVSRLLLQAPAHRISRAEDGS